MLSVQSFSDHFIYDRQSGIGLYIMTVCSFWVVLSLVPLGFRTSERMYLYKLYFVLSITASSWKSLTRYTSMIYTDERLILHCSRCRSLIVLRICVDVHEIFSRIITIGRTIGDHYRFCFSLLSLHWQVYICLRLLTGHSPINLSYICDHSDSFVLNYIRLTENDTSNSRLRTECICWCSWKDNDAYLLAMEWTDIINAELWNNSSLWKQSRLLLCSSWSQTFRTMFTCVHCHICLCARW